jgi:hypothetical protein
MSDGIVNPCPVCGGEITHGHHDAQTHERYGFAAISAWEARRLAEGYGCERCDYSGWLWDETACGDEDHCTSYFACSCNPEYK